MQVEVVAGPVDFRLVGLSSPVKDGQWGPVGVGLMNRLWAIVGESDSRTTGINYWVYPHDASTMFVGLELADESPTPDGLEALEFRIGRHLKHLHIGPHNELPEKWNALKGDLADRGETPGSHSVEIYGHHCEDEASQETTILIGLADKLM